jgi:hypothetical protein
LPCPDALSTKQEIPTYIIPNYHGTDQVSSVFYVILFGESLFIGQISVMGDTVVYSASWFGNPIKDQAFKQVVQQCKAGGNAGE